MPTFDFNQLSSLPISELTFTEPAGSAARNDSGNLFKDYLQQANNASKLSDADNPKADSPVANERDADRSSPPKADNVRQPADQHDTAPQKSESSDHEPSNEASSLAEGDKSAAAEVSSATPNEERTGQNNAKETPKNDTKSPDSKPSEKVAVAVKDKKKIKDEKNSSKPAAESSAAAQMNSADPPAIHEAQPSKDNAEKGDAADHPAVDAEQVKNASDTVLPAGDPASKKVNNSQVDAHAALSASINEAQAVQEEIGAAENQKAVNNPAEMITDVAGDGKTKSNKSREAAAEEKNAQQKQKNAGESQAVVSALQESETPSATVGKDAGDVAKTPSVMLQASAGVLQSVLEVLKPVEKQPQTEDSVGSIGDVRANSATPPATASATPESGSAPVSAGSDSTAQAVRTQFVQRVERAFAAMGNRDGSVRLKLSPPELGVLKLEIGVHQGVMKARVEAETPAAKSLLLENLPGLRDRLAQQNIHIQQFDVDLMDRPPGGMPQQTFGQADADSQQGNRSTPRANNPEFAAVSTASAQRAGMGGGLNVIV